VADVSAYAGPTEAPVDADATTIETWLKFWFAHCTHGVIEIAWTGADSGALEHAQHFILGDEHEAAEFAARTNRVPGQNVYVSASTVSLSTPHRAKDSHFVQAGGIWLDQDDQADVERGPTIEPLLQPSAVIITGTIPHVRRQCWFRTSIPLTNADEVKRMNQRVRALYGGDPSVVNPVRVMRLPGSIAWPVKKNRVIEQTKLYISPNPASQTYALDRLIMRLPPLEQTPTLAPLSGEVIPPAIDRPSISDLMARLADGNWHVTIRDIVLDKVLRGESDTEIHLCDPGWTLPGWTLEDTWSKVQTAIETARAKYGRPNVDRPLFRPETDAVAAAEAFAGAPLPGTPPQPLLPGGDNIFTPGSAPIEIDEAPVLLAAYDRFCSRPPSFLIEGFLPDAQTILVTALPGIGKSPLAQAWSAHMALGIPWHGNAVTKSFVYYWAAESHQQTIMNIARFAQALLAERGENLTLREAMERVNDYVRVRIGTIVKLEQHVALIAMQLDRYYAQTGQNAVFVLDTLRAVSAAGINKDEDMQVVQDAVNILRANRPWLTIIVLHHSPKSDPMGSAGSNRLIGMADVWYSLTALVLKKTPGKKNGAQPTDDGGDGVMGMGQRLQFLGPDEDGWLHGMFRVTCMRMKDWQMPDDVDARMAVRENVCKLSYVDGDMPIDPADQAQAAFAAAPLPGQPEVTAGFAAAPVAPVRAVPPAEIMSGDLDAMVASVLMQMPEGSTLQGIADFLIGMKAPALVGYDAEVLWRRVGLSARRLAAQGVVVQTGNRRTSRWKLRG
jgi:hypothetical protein